ncbi:hypothetical protein P5V15_003072 [Pogonomyrmex californicus]
MEHHQGAIKKKSKTVYMKRFQYQWLDDNPSWRTWVQDVPGNPYKFFCKACETTLTCGVSEIRKHAQRENHVKSMEKLLKTLNIKSEEVSLDEKSINIDNPELTNKISVIVANKTKGSETTEFPSDISVNLTFKERVRLAEIKLATFIVKNKLPYSISSQLLSLIRDVAKEPSVLQAITLGRTKLKYVVDRVTQPKDTDSIFKI